MENDELSTFTATLLNTEFFAVGFLELNETKQEDIFLDDDSDGFEMKPIIDHPKAPPPSPQDKTQETKLCLGKRRLIFSQLDNALKAAIDNEQISPSRIKKISHI